MIIKYNPDTIYDPNKEINRIRRAVKVEIDRSYVQYPFLPGLAWKLVFSIPGFRIAMKLLYKRAKAIEAKFMLEEQKQEALHGITIHDHSR